MAADLPGAINSKTPRSLESTDYYVPPVGAVLPIMFLALPTFAHVGPYTAATPGTT